MTPGQTPDVKVTQRPAAASVSRHLQLEVASRASTAHSELKTPKFGLESRPRRTGGGPAQEPAAGKSTESLTGKFEWRHVRFVRLRNLT